MTLDLSKYLSQDQGQESPSSQEQPTNQPLELDRYLAPESSSAFDNFKRHAARTGSRVGETIAGFPGDFVNFIQFMADKLPQVPTGKPNALQELGRQGLAKLPTSEDLRQISEQYTKGYTKAQGPGEELGDEVASLASALLIPARNPLKFKNLLGAVGKAAAAKGAGEIAELYGAGPKTKAATEIGMLFLTGMIGKKTANQFISEKYEQAKSAIPKGDIVPTSKLLSGLEKVEKELSKGVSTATKSEVLTPLRELQTKASGGGILAEDLVQTYHDLNEKLTAKKLFQEMSKGERAVLRKRYDLLRDEVRNTITEYGKDNPTFFKAWQEANQGYATIAKSKSVSNFIEKKFSSLPSHLAGGIAIDLFRGHPMAAAATLGAAVPVKGGELLYRIAKSPSLTKHYINVISAAGQENLPALIKSLNQLEKELKD